MNCKHIKGMDISVVSLGTVQLGMSYGINNANGKPDEATAFAILDCAVKNGINALDTAAAYGDSEAVIGRWLEQRGDAEMLFVMTKAKTLDHSSYDALWESLFSQVQESKERLGLTQLPLLMLHNCEDYLNDQENMKRAFAELKAGGHIRFSGISAYSTHDYGELAKSGFDAVQIPINLFDWGQIENGGLRRLHESGMMIFVRSVYLQGLVFQEPEKLAPQMAFCKDTLVKFRALCKKYDLSPAALAMSFVLSLPEVTSLVLGCETVAQVEDNIRLLEHTVTLSDEQMAEIRENFLHTDTHVLHPGTWPK